MVKVLCIEDHPNQRVLYEQELSDEGYEVISTGDGKEGLELFMTHRPDIVVMDVLLPGMNGIEVMERLLAIAPKVPIIVHSAYSSPSHDFITWFARAYVVKSGDLEELKKHVRLAALSVTNSSVIKGHVPAPVTGRDQDLVSA